MPHSADSRRDFFRYGFFYCGSGRVLRQAQDKKAFGWPPWVAIYKSIQKLKIKVQNCGIPRGWFFIVGQRRTGHCSKGSVKFYILFKGLRSFSGYLFFIAPKTTKIKTKAAITMAAQAIPLIFNNVNIHTSLKNGVIPLFYWPAVYFVNFFHLQFSKLIAFNDGDFVGRQAVKIINYLVNLFF